jgi:hypothetical protein
MPPRDPFHLVHDPSSLQPYVVRARGPRATDDDVTEQRARFPRRIVLVVPSSPGSDGEAFAFLSKLDSELREVAKVLVRHA